MTLETREARTTSPIRLAVVGLGFMGSVHLKALREVEDVRLAAVCSNNDQALSGDLSGIQGNLGGPGERMDFSAIKKFRDVHALLADPEIDAVDLCLPTHLHADLAIAALRQGKHVLVEKPIAIDGASADRMLEEAAHSGRLLMTAQVLRFFPAYMALRDSIAGAKLGAVRTGVFRRRCAAPAWGGGWLKDPSLSGGGVFDLLIHDVDMMLHLFGMPQSVAATGYQDDARGIDVINAGFHYPDGRTVLITGGWHHPKSYPFSMEYTVVADGGTVEYSSAGRAPSLYSSSGESHELPLATRDGYAAEIEYFAHCCATGEAPAICPPRESADAVKLTLFMVKARSHNGEKLECTL